MTPKQVELARHALGLDRATKSYRNHFVTGEGAPDYIEWCAMVEAGEARYRPGTPLSGGDPVFWLTLAGASLALRQGERLDMEDFPKVKTGDRP